MSKKRILIVDDELNILKSLQRILEDNYIVEIALGGKAAIDLLAKQNDFNVIISDFMMPEVDGPELYDHIKQHHPGLAQRMIIMTGGTYSIEVKSFLNRSKRPCLLKPFEHKELLDMIKKVDTNE